MNTPTPTGAILRIADASESANHITRCIEQWSTDMRRRRCAESSVKSFAKAAHDCSAHNGWVLVDHLTLAGAQNWLATKRETWGPTTHDQAASRLRCWGKYLHQIELLPKNPFQHLESSGEQGGEGVRAFTTDECVAMIRTARERARRTGKDKGNAALFYAFCCMTGLRSEEAATCTWQSIDLDAHVPCLVTRPDWSKNHRRGRVAMSDELIWILRHHRTTVPNERGQLVFPVNPNRHTFAKDRAQAGVQELDARGRGSGMHSFRKWLATMVDRLGASPGLVSSILRHAGTLAEERYIDRDLREQKEILDRLPPLWDKGLCTILDENSKICVDTRVEIGDSTSVTAMSAQPLTSSPLRACLERSSGGDTLGSSARQARNRDVSDQNGSGADALLLADIEHGNGHSRAQTESSAQSSALADLVEAQAAQLAALARAIRGGAS